MVASIDLEKDKKVLLFYKKHKWDYLEENSLRTVSGFYAWYLRLVECLTREGYSIYENNYDLAAQNPNYPIGIVGAPIILENWVLPNPAILGPSMYDHPMINPDLMLDKRFVYYIVTCQWMKDVFQTYYGSSCILWNAGIETDIWTDTRDHYKDIDVLLYEKIRWNRTQKASLMLDPIINSLQKRRLNYHVLKYGNISHQTFKQCLSRSKSMVFLCEYETQGMAYQEALASNVPIFAWDPGYCLDPYWEVYEGKPMPATSVPYFSDDCGKRFKIIKEFDQLFDQFWKDLSHYRPREFVESKLSMTKSAKLYMEYYNKIYNQGR